MLERDLPATSSHRLLFWSGFPRPRTLPDRWENPISFNNAAPFRLHGISPPTPILVPDGSSLSILPCDRHTGHSPLCGQMESL